MATIRIGTFNLFQFAEPPHAWYHKKNQYSVDEWPEKRSWVMQQLTDMQADVVGFQEVFSPEALKKLCMEVGYPYFATVDEPHELEDEANTYDESVVALASKFPIKRVEAVIPSDIVLHDLPVVEDFRFSRVPLKATLDMGDLGEIVVYVLHLKSKRPMPLPSEELQQMPWSERVAESMRLRSRAQVASALQRGTEATILYHDITHSLAEDYSRPLVVMGDLNDDNTAVSTEALTNRRRVYEIDDVRYHDLPDEAKIMVHSHQLYDSFDLAPNPTGPFRQPTHFYRGQGNVLDYIFVSNALNERNHQRKGRVKTHQVYSMHLQADGVNNQLQSDHGQVVISIDLK